MRFPFYGKATWARAGFLPRIENSTRVFSPCLGFPESELHEHRGLSLTSAYSLILLVLFVGPSQGLENQTHGERT